MCTSLRLQRFCCCCTTKTGSLVIATAGWILTVAQVIGLGKTIKPLTRSETKENTTKDDDDEYKFLESDKSDLGFEIGYAVISLLICGLLIWGIYKRDKRFMMPWLVLKAIEIVLGLLAVVFMFIVTYKLIKQWAAVLLVIDIIMLIIVGIFCYAWLCVWSHYMELSEGVALPVYYYPTSEQAQVPPSKG